MAVTVSKTATGEKEQVKVQILEGKKWWGGLKIQSLLGKMTPR